MSMPQAAHRKMHQAPTMGAMVGTGAQLSMILIGIIALTAALDASQVLFAPITAAIVIGIMVSPLASRMEQFGLPSAASALITVLGFMALIAGFSLAVAAPLSEWSRYLPVIWTRLEGIAAEWKGIVASLDLASDALGSLAGGDSGISVSVDEGSPVMDAAMLAPQILMQVIVFLASLFFFIQTRDSMRQAVLSLCFERKLRWRVAHIFRDIGQSVSRYLLSITLVNIVMGVLVWIAMTIIGVPSPWLWGILAGLLNYAIYIGPAVMAVIMLGVGLATGGTTAEYLLPVATYLTINLLEAQIVTPNVVGRQLTLNPFVVFIGVGYWIWLWGAVGGFVAVPLLLVAAATIRHVIPGLHRMTARDINLARGNAPFARHDRKALVH